MAVQSVVQLYVVPRVEVRKRREDRWERDVLALGELLTAELPDRANAAKKHQWFLQLMNDLQPSAVTDEQHAEGRGLAEEASEAVASYKAVANTRADWLVKRIISLAPTSDELQRFHFAYTRFLLASIACTGYTRPIHEFDEPAFEREWANERRIRMELTKAVEILTSSTPPRQPSRLRQRVRRFIDWRKQRQVKREGRETLTGP
jgi:hypothetical protein